MQAYALTSLVTVLALLLYSYMGIRVGGARAKYKIEAPATTGDPHFERHFRVHMNTLEWLPLFLPALWMTAGYWGDQAAAAGGALWIAGRFIYMMSYVKEPKSRSLGFGIQALAGLGLLFASLAGAVLALMSAYGG